MFTQVGFYRKFSKRMGLLSIITGLFISLTMPLIFFVLSWSDEKLEADSMSQDIEKAIIVSIKENPLLWKNSLLNVTKLFSEIERKQISKVEIYDLHGTLVHSEVISPSSFFDRKGHADIMDNNQRVGYIEVSIKTSHTFFWTFIIFLFSTISGVGAALMLFRFPNNIVKQAQEEIDKQLNKLKDLSYSDQLTGVYNRAFLHVFLPELIEQTKVKDEQFALLYIDLDNFKNINDSLGHTFGDLFLKTIGDRLRTFVSPRDKIVRLGGDEFIIVVSQIKNQKEAIEIAEEVIALSRKAVFLDGHEQFITMSIGLSFYPEDGETMSLLVRNADTAMYAAKSRGKNKYCLYEWSMNRVIMERLKMEHYLRNAAENEEFYLVYQPKFNLYNNRIVGCEVLIRWNQPNMGMISPNVFIPLAEETGLIIAIGEWVLKNAFSQVKEWVSQYPIDFRFSINLCPLQFQHVKLISMIKSLLDETQLDSKYVEIEITERITMDHVEEAFNKLTLLKEMGFEISIDDFGTGFSSMSYLSKFPIDILKIAMEFIRDIDTDKANEAIVSAIIAMAHNLNLKVIAEGIETGEQINILKGKHCEMGQGYYFCKPLPADEFIQFILQSGLKTIKA